jgi:predicted anti-sigma-YlaC factor YlaD
VSDYQARLMEMVRSQVAERQPWEQAEGHLREVALRQRLACMKVQVTPDVAVVLMATAMLLVEGSEEWGGDYRDALGDIAALGLGLLGSD